jgi:hypothetical protein
VPFGLDHQDALRHLDVKILLGVEAGQLSPDNVAAVLDIGLDAHWMTTKGTK